VNFAVGDTVPNGATVPLDGGGALCVYSPAALDLVVDVNGFFSSHGDASFVPINPTRALDTRDPGRSSLAAGSTVDLRLAGAVLPADARTAVLNVTSTNVDADGYVTVYPCDAARPLAASVNPMRGKSRPNLVVAPLSADGRVCFYSQNSTDLVVDVTGFIADHGTREFTPVVPFRHLDTRELDSRLNAGTYGMPVLAGQTLKVPVAGARGIPADAGAVSVNVTAVGASGPGYLTVWPCGERPSTSTVNYEATLASANGAQLALADSGELCIFSQQDVHVVVDINGWWR
jgi:hypothetical protein